MTLSLLLFLFTVESKLHWHKHQRIILQKAQKALSSLSRTSYSTWGFPVLTARLVYTAILRSVLSYAVGIWFNPLRKSCNISSLIIFQNKCLRLIGGAFKATPSFLLEIQRKNYKYSLLKSRKTNGRRRKEKAMLDGRCFVKNLTTTT